MARPRLRFRGFTDSWSLKKLTDMTDIYNGLTYHPKDKRAHGTLVLRSSNIQSGKIVHNKDVVVNNAIVNSPNVQPKDVIIVVRNGSRHLIGKHALVNHPMPNTVIGAFMNAFRCQDGYFLEALLGSNEFKKDVHESLGATINQLTKADFRLMRFLVPSLSLERQKIGHFFNILDKLIDLQRNKLKLLRKLKLGYIQKMFPRKNEIQPRIRFDGFHDDWQRKNITEIADIVGGGTPSTRNPQYWDGSINWYSPDEISNSNYPYAYRSRRKITQSGLTSSSAHLHPANSTVLLTTRATIGDMAILKTPAATNQGFQSLELHSNVDTYFIYSYQPIIKRQAVRLSHGSTFKEVSKGDLKEMDLLIPSLPEQRKIGEFFKHLDTGIGLQRSQLKHLEQLKKAYLQKMFC